LGLSGRVPRRVDAVTKAGLLDLITEAVDSGWSIRDACRALELKEVRVHRWFGRRARGRLADGAPGGSPMHGLLPEEAEQILALFDEWGETDRSHRKLAHRGSYLDRFWVAPSTVRRVLFLADKHFRPLPRPGKSHKRPFPEWADYTPNSIWIYDTTHFTRAGMAVLIIEDLISRKWITEIVSVEETSTQVELAFTAALEAEGLFEAIDARHADGRIDLTVDDQSRPILLVVSDNGPQMISGSTREFMALCVIAQHFGRPGTPTDQAWIESLNGHIKAEYRTCSRSKTRPPCALSSPTSASTTTPSGCTPGSAMSLPTTSTKDADKPSAKPERPASNKHVCAGLPTTENNAKISPSKDPPMLSDSPRIYIANSETRQLRCQLGDPDHNLAVVPAGESRDDQRQTVACGGGDRLPVLLQRRGRAEQNYVAGPVGRQPRVGLGGGVGGCGADENHGGFLSQFAATARVGCAGVVVSGSRASITARATVVTVLAAACTAAVSPRDQRAT